MIVQLQPEQISHYWEIIRYAATAAMELEPPAHEYSQALFTALLSETHQCWLILNSEGNPSAMGITCILEENLTGIRRLHVDAFYSYYTLSEELALEAAAYVKQYALANGCQHIRALTNNPRAMRLLELVGFVANKTEYLLTC
jgi:hypothetical protein